jgi:hypothetical protein
MVLTFVKLAQIRFNVFTHDIVMVADASGGRMVILVLLLRNRLLSLVLVMLFAAVVGEFGCHR